MKEKFPWTISNSLLRRTAAVFFIVLFVFFLVGSVFAAIPVQGSNLKGEAALNARFSLIAAAEKYLGTPYRYSGLDAGGLDCTGLVFVSFRDSLRVTVPRVTGSLYSWTEKIPTSELRPGDLVFFTTVGSAISHVGIFVGNGRFIHAASEGSRTGVIYSSLDEAYWKRTYTGAGRALPWDSGAETALAETVPAAAPSAVPGQAPHTTETPAVIAGKKPSVGGLTWGSSSGFFVGGGLAWTGGGLLPGAPSPLRGLAGQIKIGYKGFPNDLLQIALELRPEWDQYLEIFRLPLTLSLGNDKWQFFAGPALTLGEPALQTGEKYHPAFTWLGELGLSGALEPINIGQGILSLYGEAAWQPYLADAGQPYSFGADFTANIRVSVGVRYLFLLGEM